jgi:fumarylpyruvate hydrolase
MTDYAFPPAPPSFVPVVRSRQAFPVRRIFCVGRNYAEHAREMGFDPDREPPFFFTKPADAVVHDGATIAYPPLTENFHYEAELVVAIGQEGRNLSVEASLGYIWGYAIGNDLTRRDLQIQAREKGRPWDWGKAFDNSAVIGPIHPVSEVGHLTNGSIRLTVNGAVKQDANLTDLIWSVPEIVSILSHAVVIRPGDLIMTGTPAGVGPLMPGDVCVVSIQGLGDLTSTIGPIE